MQIQTFNTTRQPPTVRATLAADGVSWRITCPLCHTVHVHGAGDGHRAAHCEKGTRHKEVGYILLAPLDDFGQEAA